MTLNFWPFNLEQKRQATERRANTEARVEEVRTNFFNLPTPPPLPCSDCGGLFVSDKLKPVTSIKVSTPSQRIVVTEKHFCAKCLPVTKLEVELVSSSGSRGILDTVYFSTQEGYLQPFDFQGEEQTFLSSEDYARATCNDCGEIINDKATAKCRQCSTPKRQRK